MRTVGSPIRSPIGSGSSIRSRYSFYLDPLISLKDLVSGTQPSFVGEPIIDTDHGIKNTSVFSFDLSKLPKVYPMFHSSNSGRIDMIVYNSYALVDLGNLGLLSCDGDRYNLIYTDTDLIKTYDNTSAISFSLDDVLPKQRNITLLWGNNGNGLKKRVIVNDVPSDVDDYDGSWEPLDSLDIFKDNTANSWYLRKLTIRPLRDSDWML